MHTYYIHINTYYICFRYIKSICSIKRMIQITNEGMWYVQYVTCTIQCIIGAYFFSTKPTLMSINSSGNLS